MKRKCEENNTTTCSSSSSSAPLDKKQSKTDSTTQCRHPKLLNGMCLYCLKDVPLDGYVEESYGVYVLEEQVHDTALSILKERKLSLVLDLDNTLIRCEASPLPNVLADDLRGKSSYTARLISIKSKPNLPTSPAFSGLVQTPRRIIAFPS